MNQLERKEKLDKDMKEHLKSLQKADAMMPKGDYSEYAHMIHSKVEKYEEDKNDKYGGLTEEEFKEAQILLDPNHKAMT